MATFNPYFPKAKCGWCYSQNLRLLKENGINRKYKCNECGGKCEIVAESPVHLRFTSVTAGKADMEYRYGKTNYYNNDCGTPADYWKNHTPPRRLEAECDWCYSENVETTLDYGVLRNHVCRDCSCEFRTEWKPKERILSYKRIKDGLPLMESTFKKWCAECDWCYCRNIETIAISEDGVHRNHICHECSCEFSTEKEPDRLYYRRTKDGVPSMEFKYKRKKFNNEYNNDYDAFKRQNTKATLHGTRYAIAGATAGGIFGPVGGVIGGIGGFFYGSFKAHEERIINNGDCPTWGDVGKEAIKTSISVAKQN